MEWVLYALLGTQIVLILLALRGLWFLVEIARPDPHIRWIVADVDFVLKNVDRQTRRLIGVLQNIEDRIAKEGQVRNELLRKLLEYSR